MLAEAQRALGSCRSINDALKGWNHWNGQRYGLTIVVLVLSEVSPAAIDMLPAKFDYIRATLLERNLS